MAVYSVDALAELKQLVDAAATADPMVCPSLFHKIRQVHLQILIDKIWEAFHARIPLATYRDEKLTSNYEHYDHTNVHRLSILMSVKMLPSFILCHA